MKKRTFANRIEQLGRIAILEGEIMRRNHQHGTMTRTNTARRILCQYMINIFGRVLDTTNPADKAATTARSYTAAQFQGKQEKSESQNDTPRRYVVAVSTNDRRPASRIFSTMEAAENVYNNLKKHFLRFGYTLADSGGTDATHGLCELWTKCSINRNIEIYPIL